MHWIIGDIHGMLAPLETLIGEIERRDPQRQLLFAGDYVNRGQDSRRVIDLLVTLKNAAFARGNHDDVFAHVLHDASFAGTPGEYERVAQFKWFMNYGLYQTLRSYGISERDLVRADEHATAAVLDQFAQAVPAEHHAFIRDLRPVLEAEDFFVVHAKWEIDRKTESPSIGAQVAARQDLRRTLIWGRYDAAEIAAEKPWGRRGYFGHTPVTTYDLAASAVPIIGPKIVLVDTGAALPEGQRLTAFCHETAQFLQAHASGRLIRSSSTEAPTSI